MKKTFCTVLKHLASPGSVSEKFAIISCYLVILMLFPLDVVTGPQVSLHVLYVFPLTLIALHCSKSNIVLGATMLAVAVQLITLTRYNELNQYTRIYLFLMIILSNATFVLVARFARNNTLEASRLATIDPLTKLFNRRVLEIALENEVVRQRRYGGYFSIALIDLDGFKKLNDSMGHHVGDDALMLLAEVLKELTRESDTISRIGGDEFVVLMPNTLESDCEILCQLFCKKIGTSMAEAMYGITASIGYTTIDTPPSKVKDVLTIADKAMYRAKTNGKGQVARGDAATLLAESEILTG